MKYEPHGCPIRYGLGLFGDKWSLLIIRDLMFKGKQHYGEFLEAGEGISTNILADRLERLEVSKIVIRKPDPTHGKKIVYSLSDKGLDLMPVMLAIIDWSEKYDDQTEVPEKFITEFRSSPDSFQLEMLASLKSESQSQRD